MGPEAEALGRAFRERREAAGITQAEVRRRSGLSKALISRLEAGQHLPRLDTVVLLARALGVPPTTLLASLDEVARG